MKGGNHLHFFFITITNNKRNHPEIKEKPIGLVFGLITNKLPI